MTQVVEAVPNFSEGRDRSFVDAVVEAFARHRCEVLHKTMDPDHHRSVVTVIGDPGAIEEGALAAVEVALSRLDLRDHRGVHPRVGALDVLPFVPLRGVTMRDAVGLAHRVGRRIARMGVPVHFYGAASDPPGRGLASIRRRGGAPVPDMHPTASATHATARAADPTALATHATARAVHPTAGATCVGARPVLLAWNVDVGGISLDMARGIAARIREAGGGFRGLRALGLLLAEQDRLQVSMNLENPAETDPRAVFDAIKARVERLGGWVVGTEVIGMLPDQLADRARAEAMLVRDWSEDRVLSTRVDAYCTRVDAFRAQ